MTSGADGFGFATTGCNDLRHHGLKLTTYAFRFGTCDAAQSNATTAATAASIYRGESRRSFVM